MNFFITSHGKGVVDGIGGTVKRTVWRHIEAEKSHVTNPQEYASLVVKYIAKSEIGREAAF